MSRVKEGKRARSEKGEKDEGGMRGTMPTVSRRSVAKTPSIKNITPSCDRCCDRLRLEIATWNSH